jgi:hypothetical protein
MPLGRKFEKKTAPVNTPIEFEEDTPKGPVARTFTLVGVTFSGYDFTSLRNGQRLQLVPDPYGKVVKTAEGHGDPDAISCQDLAGKHIGYLSKQTAKVLSAFFAQHPELTHATRVHRIKGGGDELSYGVDILVVFDEIKEAS